MGKNYFEALNKINVNDYTEKKNGLTYLSWAWAWQQLKMMYPKSFYTVYESQQGWNYFTDGKTCWVKTGVTVVTDEDSIEHIEYLPVMDFRNKSIPFDGITSFDVNKAIQRSLTKAVARHGLGIYIYAGEDLPQAEAEEIKKETEKVKESMASDVEKKTFMDACEAKKQDYKTVLKAVGVTDKMTKAQYVKAMEFLKGVK